MLLGNYAACKTQDFLQAQSWIEANTFGSKFSITEDAGRFSYRANVCRLKDMSMLWWWGAAANRISFPPQGFVQNVFQIAGSGSFTTDGNQTSHEAAGACLFVPAEVAFIQESSADSEQLVLGISAEALKVKMAVLLGADVDNFELLRPSAAEIVLLRQAIFSFAHELNQFGPLLSCIALAEMEQMIIFRFLLLIGIVTRKC